MFGVDEMIVLGVVLIYGSIVVMIFGYLDKVKVGIIEKLDCKKEKGVNIFLDDLVVSVVFSVVSCLVYC